MVSEKRRESSPTWVVDEVISRSPTGESQCRRPAILANLPGATSRQEDDMQHQYLELRRQKAGLDGEKATGRCARLVPRAGWQSFRNREPRSEGARQTRRQIVALCWLRSNAMVTR